MKKRLVETWGRLVEARENPRQERVWVGRGGGSNHRDGPGVAAGVAAGAALDAQAGDDLL